MKYETLFIDVDNTILDFTAAEAHAIRQLFSEYELPNDDATIKTYSRINDKYWKLFETGVLPKERILVARFEETLSALGYERNATEMSKRYFFLLSECHFVIDGAEDVLSYLKDCGYKIYATTNGVAATQYKRIAASGIEKYFDDIFVSETAGAKKPEKEYFDYVLSKIGNVCKDKILVIGDSMTSDIKGGINSGFDTCWYDGYGEERLFEPTYTVSKIQELKNLL